MIRQLNVSAFQKAVQKNEIVAKQAYPISLGEQGQWLGVLGLEI